jgi:hypothetical protein
MKLRQRTHWGPLAFTLAIGLGVLSQIAGVLTRPLPVPPVTSVAESEEPTAPVSDRTPLPEELHSQWYTQTQPPLLSAGETAHITIQYRNVGHTEWISGSPSEIRLGEIGPRPLPPEMRVNWLYWDRPARQSELVVLPQQLATFTFQVAGAAPGVYRLNVRPVVDGVAWLEDEGVFVDITVE